MLFFRIITCLLPRFHAIKIQKQLFMSFSCKMQKKKKKVLLSSILWELFHTVMDTCLVFPVQTKVTVSSTSSSICPCLVLHSTPIFLFVRNVLFQFLLCHCASVHCAVFLQLQSQLSPISCIITKTPPPGRNKRGKVLKRKQSLLWDHLLCPFFQALL